MENWNIDKYDVCDTPLTVVHILAGCPLVEIGTQNFSANTLMDNVHTVLYKILSEKSLSFLI